MSRYISIRRIAAAVMVAAIQACNAAAPMQKIQAPGFYRMILGQFEITALSDGGSPLPVSQMLRGVDPGRLTASLRDAFLDDPVETSVNAFLINTGSKLVLIDTGAGTLLGPRQGKLLANLRASGYLPEQVDEIDITHMHGDHVGGLSANGKPVFPNAVVRASRQDAEFWLDERRMRAAPESMRVHFEAAMNAIGPYARLGRFKPFDGETVLQPGITARPAPGHTPGHTVYVVESGGSKLLVIGDLIHLGAVQLANPAITVQYDVDPRMAARTRESVLAEAAHERYWVAAAHLPFPGMGHLRASGTGYVLVPVNYSSLP